MTDYLYRFLPSGNSHQFPWAEAELKRREVAFEVCDFPAGGRMYRIPKTEADKLPKEDGEPYLGDEEQGWSLFDNAMWEETRAELHGSEWRTVDHTNGKCPTPQGERQ